MSTRGTIRAVCLVLGVAIAASLLAPADSYADNRAPYNTYEQKAKDACSGADRRGAIWFTNLSGSYYGNRDGIIEVGASDTSITVYIRGSVYGCGNTSTSGVGAVEVYPNGTNSWRLTGLSGSTFSRGTSQGRNNWSTQGGGITATLNISGLATNNTGRVDTQDITVGIHRRFQNTSTGQLGTADTEYVTVRITRAARPPVWSLSGSSTVRVGSGSNQTNTTAKPGQRLTWTHRISNSGPDRTSVNVYSNLGLSGFSNGWATGVAGATISRGAGTGVVRTYGSYNVYDVTQSDVGNTLCQWTQYDPYNAAGARNGRGNQACVAVPYDYSLTPSVSVQPAGIAEVGAQVTVDPRVANSGPTKSRPMDEWQISYMTMSPGSSVPGATTRASTQDPCDYYDSRPGVTSCSPADFNVGSEASVGGGQVVAATGRNFIDRYDTVEDLPVGTMVCYALSVRARSSGSDQWAHSPADCFVIAKRPVTQVLGGDLLVGRGGSGRISTSVKVVGATRYGSWSEYGVVAPGSIYGMASASGYANGSDSLNGCGVSFLTFSNDEGGGCNEDSRGGYNMKSSASTIAARFPASAGEVIAGDKQLASFESRRIYTDDGSTAINIVDSGTTSIGKGMWFVVNAPDATVRIMNDIRYTTDALTSIGEIPQVVIIAKNIVIADNVSQVDAWLVTTGTGSEGNLNTCGAGGVSETTAVTANNCNTALRVNGPVVANHLLLRRSAGAGADADSGDPAEVFNLRPDAYMWAMSIQESNTKARTVMTTELPPRY